jgi:NAD(P)-dependent dehydrogenase (short-subunit alcohol dehydrogenase family)
MTGFNHPALNTLPPPNSTLLVFGGCGGIGRCIVDAAHERGLRVAVADLPQSIEQNPPPEGVITLACDATQSDQIKRACNSLQQTWGHIRAVINLVGFTKEQVSVADMSESEWDEIIDGTLRSAFLIAHHVYPLLAAGEDGVLINTSSTFGVSVPYVGYAPYGVAKAGIINLTRALATEFAPNIRVNAIAPGLIDTAFLQGGTGRPPKTSRVNSEAALSKVALKRIGRPEDIAGIAMFLISPSASYITSQTLHVNGGMWS